VTLWQTVIYFVYKLSLRYRSFKAIAGCTPDSSSSRTARQHTTRSEQNWLWANCPDFITKTNGYKIRRIQTQWTITCNVQCWRLTASLKQNRKQSLNSRNCFRLSGATYHKDRSTKRWKTSQIKRMKACVGAGRCWWTFRIFTVTMKLWHLIIS